MPSPFLFHNTHEFWLKFKTRKDDKKIIFRINMVLALTKVFVAAGLISFVSWLSGQKTGLAGLT